ncbi:MAG: HD domain-containing protein [Sulfuricurvum sp.]|jgi:HD-GYP domain-containing protein (c-di-GMP phosphodiesterase class II)|uniref:HD-GYP domain-containing protein n=1 Tax=Sulfuricurvum sp. TaxID=2025608 RepID=UPI0025FD2A2F|nr:HD domain-containing phosphohydrolase [Sulfuricurvum sp.]MCK9371943.1 HD domain-containing protein [Sulfuricurvum sp.]
MQKRYKLIDKRLITEGSQIDFNLFLPNETKTSMSLFLQSHRAVDADAKVKLREIEMLYVREEDEARYKAYVERHIQSVVQNGALSTEQKGRLIYEKAAESIDAMFKNPESLENVKNAEPVVKSFIDIILHDKSAVESLMHITAHDYYTHTHSINVSIYTLSLGSFLGITGKDLEALGMAAILHDLGKSKVDYSIINKNGKLTDVEFDQMKKHPALGHAIALELGISDERILTGIRHHHERIEGGGYPDNLRGGQISQFARIIGVCDVFDALSTKRSYKDPMSSFESLRLMKQQMAEHLDIGMVDAFIRMLHK